MGRAGGARARLFLRRAGDASYARELLATSSYEIVLLDVNMPGESGVELLSPKLDLGAENAERLRLASQLHDVGKVAVPDSILRKRGKLSNEEFDVIKTHAETGYKMLAGSSSEVVQLGAQVAYTHHERWDGNGYPRHLRGEEIPVEGRIAALADVFDALTSDRVYRPAFPLKTAVEMMRSERATHFDPEMLDAFLDTLDELEGIRHTYAD